MEGHRILLLWFQIHFLCPSRIVERKKEKPHIVDNEEIDNQLEVYSYVFHNYQIFFFLYKIYLCTKCSFLKIVFPPFYSIK
jgi:hypothetical protein